MAEAVRRCDVCAAEADSLPLEPDLVTRAQQPMEQVGIDLFKLDATHYLVMIDRYSGYPFVAQLLSLSSAALIAKLSAWFLD